MKKLFITLLALLTACASPGTPPAPDLVTVQHTFSTHAWLPDLYSCASEAGIAISIETRAADFFDPSSQLSLRLGEPAEISAPAYEIGTEEIVVVTHPENPIQSLALSDLRALFSGGILNWNELGGKEMPVQVWAFGSGEDIRQIYNSAVMLHQPITSQVQLAVSAESMLAGVGFDPGAIGFLPLSMANESIQIISIKDMPSPVIAPVLILLSPDVGQAVTTLISCMQNK